MKRPETKLDAKDKFSNKLDLENFKAYSLGDELIYLYLHTGQTMHLSYNSQEEARKMYEKILSIEDECSKYLKHWNSIDDDEY